MSAATHRNGALAGAPLIERGNQPPGPLALRFPKLHRAPTRVVALYKFGLTGELP